MFSPLKTLYQIYIAKRPFMLNHKVNIACDCRCKSCDSWKMGEDPESLLGLEQARDMLDRFGKLGFMSYSAWGGEPLLREDLPEIMSHARERGFFTTISTNGSLLCDRARELAPSTSLFAVSIDGMSETHDHLRGVKGLFDKAIEGAEHVLSLGGKVRLFYIVNKKNAGDIEASAKLARDLKVSVAYYPMLAFPGYNDRLVLDRAEQTRAFSQVIELQKRGLPIINVPSYLKVIAEHRKAVCNFPAYHLYVDYDGEIYTCDLGPEKKHKRWGNIGEVGVGEIVSGREWRETVARLKKCNHCRLQCGEIGYGNPLASFGSRAILRLKHERLVF